jgi:hypothetical protein
MPFDPTSRRVARALGRTRLLTLLFDIEAGMHDEGDGQLAVALTGLEADHLEIAWRELDGDDLVDTLVGFEAPDDWLAFGVVCHGTARPLLDDDGPPRADPTAPATTVGLGLLVARSGVAVAGLRPPGGAFRALPDPDPLGRLPDACRRVLGLGTSPPATPPGKLWGLCWVDRVLTAALARPGALGWDDVVALRPGDDLMAVPWPVVRGLVASATEPVLGMRPEAARWMDDGMFSRELMATVPSLDGLLVELEPVLPEPLRRRLGRAVRSLPMP